VTYVTDHPGPTEDTLPWSHTFTKEKTMGTEKDHPLKPSSEPKPVSSTDAPNEQEGKTELTDEELRKVSGGLCSNEGFVRG
jgi:bacteriocin-like protein